ncbi:MAG TPA: N-formylglutamate deformylase [Steroidobacteraceae bacterium]|jgi:N-formylglutamate amidohydrolase
MPPFHFHPGTTPLLISIPHAGTAVPDDIAERFTPVGRALPDTDWYVHHLYDFARRLGASVLTANYSRYVVDLNRAPDSALLYSASPTTPVCASRTFADEPIYTDGYSPSEPEVQGRVAKYWQPYHHCIAAELARIRQEYGVALLWDAHSIASEIPSLFAGSLPEFNLGTRDGASCPSNIVNVLAEEVRASGKFSVVMNGRFKGGYITMHYGRPSENIYAVQLELAQRTYMTESPLGPWDAARARDVMECIERLIVRYLKLNES